MSRPTLSAGISAAQGARKLTRSRELVLAAASLLGLGLIAVGPHLRRGGFYADDWAYAASYRFRGWWGTSVSEWRDVIPGRPILALLHPLPHVLFGLDPTYHLATALALAVLTSLAFFAFLRALGIELPHALALALLSLVFPWADAARLWPAGAMNSVAVIAYFGGTIAALCALSLPQIRRRRATALHVLASVLYLVSVLTYEVAPAAILLSGLLYRTRVSWRTLRGRWLLDAVLVLVPIGISLVFTSHVRTVGSPAERLRDIPQFVRDGVSIFASTFLPRDAGSTGIKLVVLLAAAAIVAAALLRSVRCQDRALRLWLWRGAAGVCAAGVAYVMFLGSGLFPLYSGLDDRANTFAEFGLVVATYSLLALLALLVAGGPGRASATILAACTLLVGLGFVERVRDDVRGYDAAAKDQGRELASLAALLPRLPQGSTLFVFGYPAASAPGVPIFPHPWDLGAAVRLRWDDPSLRAVPVFERNVWCGPRELRNRAFEDSYAATYARTLFVDPPAGRVRRISSRSECRDARAAFTPGPALAGSSQ
jgi:hypothetical protein